MEGREYSHQFVNKGVCIWGCAGYTGHHYKINGRTVGTWSYNDLPIPIKEIKAAEERGDTAWAGIFDSFRNNRYREPRHPMEVAEILLTPDHIMTNTRWYGNCSKVCMATMEERSALLELHINSGVAQIPDDPTLLHHLRAYNARLQPHRIPGEEANH